MTGCALGLAEAQRRESALQDCLACLDTVLEVFPREVDPVNDEPGYAVRSLALACASGCAKWRRRDDERRDRRAADRRLRRGRARAARRAGSGPARGTATPSSAWSRAGPRERWCRALSSLRRGGDEPTVEFEDANSRRRQLVQLVYPSRAEPAKGRISVVAPVGAALLGLRVGQCLDWPVPRGIVRVRILRVIQAFQAGPPKLA
jgi:hypothetical protein